MKGSAINFLLCQKNCLNAGLLISPPAHVLTARLRDWTFGLLSLQGGQEPGDSILTVAAASSWGVF